MLSAVWYAIRKTENPFSAAETVRIVAVTAIKGGTLVPQKEYIIRKLKEDYKTETDHPGYHPAGGLLLLQGNLLQSFQTRYKDWICNGLPYGEYVGRNRCHQQKEHVQSGM